MDGEQGGLLRTAQTEWDQRAKTDEDALPISVVRSEKAGVRMATPVAATELFHNNTLSQGRIIQNGSAAAKLYLLLASKEAAYEVGVARYSVFLLPGQIWELNTKYSGPIYGVWGAGSAANEFVACTELL